MIRRKIQPYSTKRIKCRHFLSNISYTGVKEEDLYDRKFIFDVCWSQKIGIRFLLRKKCLMWKTGEWFTCSGMSKWSKPSRNTFAKNITSCTLTVRMFHIKCCWYCVGIQKRKTHKKKKLEKLKKNPHFKQKDFAICLYIFGLKTSNRIKGGISTYFKNLERQKKIFLHKAIEPSESLSLSAKKKNWPLAKRK